MVIEVLMWLSTCMNADCSVQRLDDVVGRFYGEHAESRCADEASALTLNSAQAGAPLNYECEPKIQISGPRPVASES
jgi:hypothetical protein